MKCFAEEELFASQRAHSYSSRAALIGCIDNQVNLVRIEGVIKQLSAVFEVTFGVND